MSNKFIATVKKDFPLVKFEESDHYKWDPANHTIHFDSQLETESSSWSLLHELGHMLLEHKDYKSDFGLLKMEAQAWYKAQEIAKKYEINIDLAHIEKCLDSYRDWLYGRSSCRECFQAGLEIKRGLYRCINCNFRWKVSPERFCRVYRKTVMQTQ